MLVLGEILKSAFVVTSCFIFFKYPEADRLRPEVRINKELSEKQEYNFQIAEWLRKGWLVSVALTTIIVDIGIILRMNTDFFYLLSVLVLIAGVFVYSTRFIKAICRRKKNE